LVRALARRVSKICRSFSWQPAAQQPALGDAVEHLGRQFLHFDGRLLVAAADGVPGPLANLRQMLANDPAPDRTQIEALGLPPVP
jgi:hypothetical protein